MDELGGKYRVDGVLGKGAMGEVLAGFHLGLRRRVAIKRMLSPALRTEEHVERFMREARAAAQLKSQHVAQIFDVDIDGSGDPYIVMEYLEGQDLRELARRRGPLPVGECVAYILQACEAIAEAHEAGIIHRDLKAANLFCARGVGDAPCIKVLDFGIAKFIPAPGREHQDLTRTYDCMGTPRYMSPEQITSTRTVDVRCDIWSLGVILYQLLTGQFPFHGGTEFELLLAIREEEPRSPADLRPDLPPDLSKLILRCLQKDPNQRFRNVPQLMQALRPFADDAFLTRSPSGSTISLTTCDLEIQPVPAGASSATQTIQRIPSPSAPIVVRGPSKMPMSGTTPLVGESLGPRRRFRGVVLVSGGMAFALVVALGLRQGLESHPPGAARMAGSLIKLSVSWVPATSHGADFSEAVPSASATTSPIPSSTASATVKKNTPTVGSMAEKSEPAATTTVEPRAQPEPQSTPPPVASSQRIRRDLDPSELHKH